MRIEEVVARVLSSLIRGEEPASATTLRLLSNIITRYISTHIIGDASRGVDLSNEPFFLKLQKVFKVKLASRYKSGLEHR